MLQPKSQGVFGEKPDLLAQKLLSSKSGLTENRFWGDEWSVDIELAGLSFCLPA